MRWVVKFIDWSADFFGSMTFILLYNLGTFAWMSMGILFPWFPDKFPYNFYTMVVSWLAINTASAILYVELRSRPRIEAQEKRDSSNLEALIAMAEANEQYMPLLKQVAQNQVIILEILKDSEEVGYHAPRD